MHKLKFLLFILLLFACVPSDQKILSKAVHGVLDLRSSPGKTEISTIGQLGVVNLDGEWEFYWNEFSPVGNGRDHSLPGTRFIPVPGAWNGFNAGTNEKPELISGDGYATYRLKILVPSTTAHNQRKNDGMNSSEPIGLEQNVLFGYSILLPTIGTAYKLFVNKMLLIQVGEIGKTPETSKPAYFTQIVRLPESPNGEYELLFHISNFDYKEGGMWYPIQFGTDNLISALREEKLFSDFFLAGAFLIMGVYHFGLYSLLRKEKAGLWFGFICILIFIRTMVTGEFSLFNFFPGFPMELGVKIDYLTWFLSIPVFILFLREIFPNESKGLILTRIQYLFYVSAIPVIILPVRLFTYISSPMKLFSVIVFLFIGFVLFRSLFNKRDGSIPFFLGTSIWVGTIINDMLYTNLLINTGFSASYGLFVFLFVQAYFLSNRFVRAFFMVEELSATLEQKVISRTEQLEQEKKKAEEANLLKDKFVGLISHDLRAPISGVHLILKIMSGMDATKTKKEMDELIDVGEKSMAMSLQMVEQVLDLSRIQSGKILPLYGKIEIASVVLSAVAKMSMRANEKNIKIQNNVPDRIFLYIDPILLGQILQNLLSNALKFCKKDDQIEIRYSLSGDYHQIDIIDTGVGIHEIMLSDLFDANIKTSTTGTMGEIGSGLGLPLSHEMLLTMNGRITVHSIQGNGSTFSVFLPASENIILVVDDNEVYRKDLHNILKDEKLIIQEAENGERALRILDKLSPDVIITDINMPVMDGFVLLKKIRENLELKDIPVIVATSGILDNKNYLKSNTELLMAIGANEVMLKPLDKERFVSILKKQIHENSHRR